MTQEFHLSITPVGQDSYLIRTEEVATGVPLAENQVTWPIQDWVQQAESLGQDPLAQLLLGGASPPPSLAGTPNVAPAVQLGKRLYQALFDGRIRDSWLAAQGVAQHRRQRLRLRLGLKDSRLQRLPWELLYGDDRPLATGTDITLARYSPGSGVADLAAMSPLPDVGQPLRVLVVVSAPDDQERLALRREVQHLMADLQPVSPASSSLGDPGRAAPKIPVALTILEQPGRSELVQALEQGQFQVLHYAGHSEVSETGGDLFLVNRETGLTEWLSGEDLAGLLVNNGIRLAVFNSCRGAYTQADDVETGWREQNLVQALVNRGVPGVIAMAERIPDYVAITFTQLLYHNLHQGYPIDLSLSRTRQGLISAYESSQSYWMLPILYLRPDFDGYLHRGNHLPLDPLNALLLDDTAHGTEATDDAIAHDLTQELWGDYPLTAESDGEDGELAALLAHLEEPQNPADKASAGPPEATADRTADELVQRLSTAPEESSAAPMQAAPMGENLLPTWNSLRPYQVPERPLEPAAAAKQPDELPHPPSPNGRSPASWPGSPMPGMGDVRDTPPVRPWAWLPIQGLSGLLLVWSLLGAVGVGAALTLAVLLGRTTGPENGPGVPPVGSVQGGSATEQGPSQGNNVVVANGLAAITADNPATARLFVEQLLDQGNLDAAQAILMSASAEQLTDPNLAFIYGRLIWQRLLQGNPDYSVEDARRYWADAVTADPDLLEGWIALGFAYYSEQDFTAAVEAWEQAVSLDRSQRRDINLDAPDALANRLTVNAYAGLATAYQKLAESSTDQNQRESYQELAEANLQRVLAVAPEIVNVNTLGRNWLWQPSTIEDWQTAVARLTSDGVNP